MKKKVLMQIIVANWKMHKTQKETVEFLEELSQSHFPQGREVWIAPSLTSLVVAEATRKRLNSSVRLGAQNVSEHSSGAFTGEIAAAQVADAGAQFVIIGHSERRQLYGETDAQIQKKIEQVVSQGLIPLLCVGETEQERVDGKTFAVLKKQLKGALATIPENLVVAYEPVWAIGTGKVATPEMANEVHRSIRDVVGDLPILYGGSVKPEFMHHLMEEPDIDGVLVGGASLSPASFQKIINY